MPGAYEKIFIHHLLSSSFHRDSVYPVQRLPLQLLVDTILSFLSVGDLIALRKVNLAFFLLTHEPVIWRRFLKEFNVPPPYIPAYVPFTLQASDFKAEHMVANFLSVQRNWESSCPELYGYHKFSTLCRVLEMKILPGGEYGVLAVSDEDGFRVTVTQMNGKFVPLASLATVERPYNLKAQYMTYNGRQGIMVWFVLKTDVERPSGTDIGYTCHVAHIGLDTLGMRTKTATLTPEPFELLVPFSFADPVRDVSVFLAGGDLYLATMLLPNDIVIINLDRNEARSMTCSPDTAFLPFDQQIRAMCFLPSQGDVMVVRTVLNGPNDVHLLELYTIPHALGRFVPIPKARVVIRETGVSNFQFSDAPILESCLDSPLPMSLYLETSSPSSIVHYTISPVKYTAFGLSTFWWSYDLTQVVQQSIARNSTNSLQHVFPGTHRALVVSIANEDGPYSPHTNLTALRRYFNPDSYVPDLLSFSKDALVKTQQLCGWRPKHLYRNIDISPHILGMINGNRITSMAWDESSGRTCLATKHDGRIHVLEFGQSVGPDAHLHRFDSLQKILKIGQYESGHPESPYPEMEMLDIIDMDDIPDELYTSGNGRQSLFAILIYMILGLTSIISLYSSVCIHVLLKH